MKNGYVNVCVGEDKEVYVESGLVEEYGYSDELVEIYGEEGEVLFVSDDVVNVVMGEFDNWVKLVESEDEDVKIDDSIKVEFKSKLVEMVEKYGKDVYVGVNKDWGIEYDRNYGIVVCNGDWEY